MHKRLINMRPKIFIRKDETVGLLAFSAYTGFVYALPKWLYSAVRAWIEEGDDTNIPEELKCTLGVGWDSNWKDTCFSNPHLLPNRLFWDSVPEPRRPILINWFITGQCPLQCKYCYAEDLMRNQSVEPTLIDLQNSAKAILSLKPVVVVLTGGDPLFGPNFARAVPLLSGRVGMMIDTSGYTLAPRHLEMIQEHAISVRISLDSERPQVHDGQRPTYFAYPELQRKIGNSQSQAIRAIELCLDRNIPVTVQTVATKKNASELIALGEKLRRWGVHSWRIFKVSPSEANYENYKRLVGIEHNDGRSAGPRGKKGPYEHVFGDLVERYGRLSDFTLQITQNEKPNAVILVGPDGKFYTESNLKYRKVLIDAERPKHPRLENIHAQVNMGAHAERYLNMTTKAFGSTNQGNKK